MGGDGGKGMISNLAIRVVSQPATRLEVQVTNKDIPGKMILITERWSSSSNTVMCCNSLYT